MRTIISLLSICFLFGACKKQSEKDKTLILDYLKDNHLDTVAQSTNEGVYYVMTTIGTGTQPTASSRVKVHYEGFLLDGTKFDSSIDRGTPATFSLTQVIEGWQIGIPLFKKGGKGQLLIPSALAYGKNPPYGSGIPRNAVLRFTIELIDVL